MGTIPGCKLRGDVNNNLLRLRFNQDSDFICMKRLLQKGADVNTKDSYDYSPIMYAAKGTSSKALDAVKYLVNKGANVDKVSGPNEYPYVNDTVLIIAAQNDYMEIVKILLEKGANFNVRCHSRSWCAGKDT